MKFVPRLLSAAARRRLAAQIRWQVAPNERRGLRALVSYGYSPDWMALSSRKRIVLSLLLSAITKRTRPCSLVSA